MTSTVGFGAATYSIENGRHGGRPVSACPGSVLLTSATRHTGCPLPVLPVRLDCLARFRCKQDAAHRRNLQTAAAAIAASRSLAPAGPWQTERTWYPAMQQETFAARHRTARPGRISAARPHSVSACHSITATSLSTTRRIVYRTDNSTCFRLTLRTIVRFRKVVGSSRNGRR
jgi:hypothetical protein